MKNQWVLRILSALLIVTLALVAVPVKPATAAPTAAISAGTWTNLLGDVDPGTIGYVTLPPARIRDNRGSTGNSASSGFNVTMGGAPVNGNTLIAVISTRGTTANRVSSITQTGATWSRVATSTNTNAGGNTIEIWYAPNVSVAGTDVAIGLAASLYAAAVVTEYSGLLTPASIDVVNAANSSGNGTAASTGTTGTTTSVNELLIGGIGISGNANTLTTITNGFNTINNSTSTAGGGGAVNNARAYALEGFASATGTFSSGGTIGGGGAQWSGAIATFKAAATSTATTFTMPAGSNRLTLAGVCIESQGATTFSSIDVRLDSSTGAQFTEITKTTGSQRENCYMGYLKDSDVSTGAHSIYLNTRLSGSTITGVHISVGTYQGVDQTSPVSAATPPAFAANNINNATIQFGGAVNFNASSVTVYMAAAGGGSATTEPSGFTEALFTAPGDHVTSVAQSVNASSGSYANTTSVQFTGGGGGPARSAVVVASLNPVIALTTAAGTVAATAASENSINVSAPYSSDDDGDNTLTIEWVLAGGNFASPLGTQNLSHTASPYSYTITGLTTSTSYDVRVTYNDPDGVTGAGTQVISGVTTFAPAVTGSWTNIYSNTGTTAGALVSASGSCTAGTGSNRVVLVAFSASAAANFNSNFSMSNPVVTYGGVTVTEITSTKLTANLRPHAWIGYVKEADIPAGAQTVSMSFTKGGTNNSAVANVKIFCATYTNVDQTSVYSSGITGSNVAVQQDSPTINRNIGVNDLALIFTPNSANANVNSYTPAVYSSVLFHNTPAGYNTDIAHRTIPVSAIVNEATTVTWSAIGRSSIIGISLKAAPAKLNQTITVGAAAPAGAAFGSSFNVDATSDSSLAVAITTTGGCSGSGTNSALITMTSGTTACVVHYNQAGNVTYNPASEVTSSTTAQKANAAITFGAAPTPTYLGGNFSVNANTTNTDSGVITYSYVSGPCAFVSGAAFSSSGAGACVVRADGAATANFNAAFQTQNISIGKAAATVTLSSLSYTYDGAAKSATAVTNPVGLTVDLTYNGSPTAPTNAGSYTVDGAINDVNYAGSATDTLVIAKANAVISVTPYSVTYDGVAHTSTGAATGVGGADLSASLNLGGTTHTNAGTYNGDAWSFTGGTNYNDANGTVDNAIGKANAVTSVTPYSVTYDGVAHTSTGTATGVGGADLSASLNLGGTTHTNAGTYTGDAWSFTGGTNYNDANGTVDNAIGKANAVSSVTPYSVTYDGVAHTSTGAATGVGGADLSASLNLGGTTHTNAGTYNGDAWSFTGGTNYNDANGTVDNAIGKANAVISVTPYSVTYDGVAHTSTGAATGAGGADLSASLNLGGTTHTNAGTYNGDAWSFTGGTNYNDANGTVDNAIGKANAVISVTPYSVTYDGVAHTSTGTATGAGGADLSASLNLNGTTHTNAGTYNGDAWGFTGGTNYNDANGTVDNAIGKANAVISVTPYSVTYDGVAHTSTGAATGVGGADLSASLNLGGTTHTNAGTYNGDAWSFTGSTNYNDANGTVDNAIGKANAVISVTPYSVTYDGVAHTSTGTATGAGGADLSASLNLGGTTHTNAGTYTGDAWSFTGGTNYNDANGTVDNAIGKATATVTLSNLSYTYDNTAKSATAVTSPVGLTVDLTYNGSPTAPTNAGSYTVDGAINDVNYAGSATDTLVIAKVDATISVTPYSVTYDGVAHTSTGTATGVGGADLSASLNLNGTTHTNAGTYNGDAWSFTGGTNYNDANGTVNNAISKATATVTLSNLSYTYDNTAKSATAVTSPVGLTVDLTYNGSPTAPTNAGSYTVDGAINDVNYAGSATDTLVIAKANAVISVTPYSVTYDGAAHTSTGTATGAGGADLSASLNLGGTTHTNAGTYNGDAWSFTGGTNYNDANGTVDNAIGKANAVISVTPYSVTYDGAAHTSTGTATGAGGADLSAGLTLSGTTHTNAGTYNGDAWSFTGGTNYNDANGTVDNAIGKANAVISVTPYSVTYDGAAHTSTGTATGAGGADLSASLNLNGTTHTNAGTYNGDAWSFTGGTNYNDANGTVDNVIDKATPVITWANPADIVYGTPLSATQLNASTIVPGAFTYLPASGTVLNAGASQILLVDFVPTDATNYNNVPATTVTINVLKVTPTLSITNSPVVYTGAPQAAVLSSSTLGTISNILYDGSATIPTNAGTYAVTADFVPTDGVNYNNLVAASAGSFVISPDNGGGPSATFKDVPLNHWAWKYIESIYTAGITGGCGTAPLIYCPDEQVTRAQMAIFILRGMHGRFYTPPAATGTLFTDIPADYWAAAWIEQLSLEGITAGCGDGTSYCPDNAISRAEMSVFLLRSKLGGNATPPPATGTTFNDVPADYWAAGWIEQLAEMQITSGCGNGGFCPEGQVTRDQMAVFIQRMFNLPLP